MTREQTQGLLAMMQATYPNFNPYDKTAAVNAWHMALCDCKWDDVQRAFAMYMRTNTSGFAPAPGQIIDKLVTLTIPQELNELEAWSMVRKALRNSTYNSDEEFAKLPEVVRKAVGSPGQLKTWAADEGFNEGVASSNFMRAYRMAANRAAEIGKMPEKIRLLIENVNQNALTAKLAVLNAQTIKSLDVEEKTDTDNSGAFHGMPERARQKLKKLGYR